MSSDSFHILEVNVNADNYRYVFAKCNRIPWVILREPRQGMNSPPRKQLAPEDWGSPPSRAKDVDTPMNSPPSRSREQGIEALSPRGMMQCAAMLGIGARRSSSTPSAWADTKEAIRSSCTDRSRSFVHV